MGRDECVIVDAKPVNTLEGLKQALIQNGPVVAGIAMYQGAMSSETAKTGVIQMPRAKEQVLGGHAIVIVGYDDEQKRVKFVNS